MFGPQMGNVSTKARSTAMGSSGWMDVTTSVSVKMVPLADIGVSIGEFTNHILIR